MTDAESSTLSRFASGAARLFRWIALLLAVVVAALLAMAGREIARRGTTGVVPEAGDASTVVEEPATMTVEEQGDMELVVPDAGRLDAAAPDIGPHITVHVVCDTPGATIWTQLGLAGSPPFTRPVACHPRDQVMLRAQAPGYRTQVTRFRCRNGARYEWHPSLSRWSR